MIKSQNNMGTEASSSSSIEIINIDDCDDEIVLLYATPPTSLSQGTTSKNAISVENYVPSTRSSRPKRLDSRDDDVVLLVSPPTKKRASVVERGQCSSNFTSNIISDKDIIDNTIPQILCEICFDSKPDIDSFHVPGCTHIYCRECLAKYVASKLQENITQIRCPDSGCNRGLLEPEHCRTFLPIDVFDRWGSALCEAIILATEKFYCPFKDCSALLIDDRIVGGEVIVQAECPYCRRLFCAVCKVAWHAGIGCEEFGKLDKDEREKEDIMLMTLAHKNKWIRCPKCRFYVEKSQGCLFMRCRCGYTFCYNCGAPLINHYCSKCKH